MDLMAKIERLIMLGVTLHYTPREDRLEVILPAGIGCVARAEATLIIEQMRETWLATTITVKVETAVELAAHRAI